MSNAAVSSSWPIGAILATVLVVAACSSGSPAASMPEAPGTVVSPSPSPADPFAGLPYRLDLPAGWAVLGTPAYDGAIDASPDVAAWLKGLDLDGQNAFRAYEPVPGAAGLRLAINPLRTWNPSPLQEEGAVAALPGVTGRVSSDVLATGADWKAFGYRWDETMDWGDGSPSARTCVGYFVMVDNPVNVVFCYPAATDRAAESTPSCRRSWSWAPRSSACPRARRPRRRPRRTTSSPRRNRCRFHADPALEALLPDTLDGRPVTKESRTGVEAGKTDGDPMLQQFGKQPADYASATGPSSRRRTGPRRILGVSRLRGVPGDKLLAFQLAQMPDAKVSQVTLGGHEVTYVEYGAWPTWMYATGDLVYGVGLAGEETAAAFFAGLP